MTRLVSILSLVSAILSTGVVNAQSSSEGEPDLGVKNAAPAGAVFTMSNAPTGNSVLAYERTLDGTLMAAGQFPTGGVGTGSGIGSQGALALTENGRYLLVVNPASNDVSVFEVHGSELELVSLVPSGGVLPTSVAVRDRLVYVLNAGANSNITGFRLSAQGDLTPIPASTRQLSSATPGAAQVAIAPMGQGVVVTEKATNLIDTFALRADGTLGPATFTPSVGGVPFGFGISKQGTIVVSEAAAKSSSSYRFNSAHQLVNVTPSLGAQQGAPCWVALTKNGRFAYVANAGGSTISGYSIGSDGALNLLDGTGVTAITPMQGKPLDMSVDGKGHLYVLDGTNSAIDGYAIDDQGGLTEVAVMMGLPATAVGMVAN